MGSLRDSLLLALDPEVRAMFRAQILVWAIIECCVGTVVMGMAFI